MPRRQRSRKLELDPTQAEQRSSITSCPTYAKQRHAVAIGEHSVLHLDDGRESMFRVWGTSVSIA